MESINYNVISKYRNYVNFEELTGKIITDFIIGEDGDALIIITAEGVEYLLDGSGGHAYIEAYIENNIEELNNVVGKKIIKAERIEGKQHGRELLYLYNIETLTSFVQIRFIGEDDIYYASEVRVFRTYTKEEMFDKINTAKETIVQIKENIKYMENYNK